MVQTKSKKKVKRNNKWITLENEYYDNTLDFTSVGLRGLLHPSMYGWDHKSLPDGEKEGFYERQKHLVDHYEWYCSNMGQSYWLRS